MSKCPKCGDARQERIAALWLCQGCGHEWDDAEVNPMKVRLFTRDGGFVHEQVIPPFNEAPAVILWGTRVFHRRGLLDRQIPVAGDREAHYIEAFAYALVP